ncbi:MAG TPA: hypothetical protein VH599_18405 [Ktedonobacterales bacterium]|jgi:hypothetical protein
MLESHNQTDVQMEGKMKQKPWNEQPKGKKIVAVLAALISLVFLLACSDTLDAEINATETAQALTPTPTPTLVHQITDLVTHYKPDGTSDNLQGVITGAAQNGTIYRVDITEKKTKLGALTARGVIQRDTYDIMDALYASSLHPTSVTVRVFGPFTDKYGNTSNEEWALAILTKETEEKFNWKGLTYRSAWAVYDQAKYLMDWLQE